MKLRASLVFGGLFLASAGAALAIEAGAGLVLLGAGAMWIGLFDPGV